MTMQVEFQIRCPGSHIVVDRSEMTANVRGLQSTMLFGLGGPLRLIVQA